jgi:hypothetical protein
LKSTIIPAQVEQDNRSAGDKLAVENLEKEMSSSTRDRAAGLLIPLGTALCLLGMGMLIWISLIGKIESTSSSGVDGADSPAPSDTQSLHQLPEKADAGSSRAA